MSKYVKYISSDHFGSPELKGDRWGYCVELLRTCLVTGFNERTDLVNFEVLTPETVKYTFTDNHNYTENQTIKISGTPFQELNDESFILSTTDKEVIVKSYNDLTGLVGQSNSVTAKAIVAPLGFIEKFKDGNRSVFTTDEEEAFFYIDDTQPSNWNATASNFCITPLIYMTDKMLDINTDVGKVIFPYNSNLPNSYKTSYMEGSYPRNGLLTITSYPITSQANKILPIKYTIIGNGRLFYFMPHNNNNTAFSSDYINTIIFGKYETINKKRNQLPYLLHGNSVQDTATAGTYSSSRYNWYKVMSSIGELSGNGFSITIKDNKKFNCAVLSCDGEVTPIYYSPVKDYLTRSTNSVYISGSNTNQTQNTDIYNKKYYVSKININNFKGNIGYLSGLLWVYNANTYTMKNNTISKYRYNNKDKYLYNYSSTYGYNNTATSETVETVYNISLDYEDWRNYE